MDQPTINPPSSGGGEPLEMPSNLSAPEPMGGGRMDEPSKEKPKSTSSLPTQPLETPPKPIGSYFIMIFLVLILIGGGVFFAAWKGWLSIGGFGGKKATPSPTVTSPTVSPAISPILSPEASSSPQITSNVNDETRKKDLANLKTALKKYYTDKSEYPQSATVIKTSETSSVLSQALVPSYLEVLPNDSQAPQYYYGYKSDGQTFELTAVLEDKSDPAGTLTGVLNIYKITNSSVE